MIFLLAGHHRKDSGAVYKGRIEAEETIRLRDALTHELRQRNVVVWNDSDDWELNRTISEIRKLSKPSDIICDLHFNAGGAAATGCEVFVADAANQTEVQLATALSARIANVLMIRNRGVKRESNTRHKKLGIMRPVGINVLVEVCFISSVYDMQQYDTNFVFLVEAIAQVLAARV